MNEQLKRRTNPFDKPIITEEREPVVKEPEYVEEVVQPTPQPVYSEPIQQYQYQQVQPRQQKRTTRQQYIQPVDASKDKYTATMDATLRRKIKIYCAQNDKMFSEFIEDACREKLSREGVK